MNAIIITTRNSSTMGYLILRCISLCLTVAILASTSWAFAPPSTHVAFGFRARIAPSLRGKQLCLSSNTLEMDRTRNNSSYEDSLESSVIDMEERNNNGVAFISSGTRDDEHEACTIGDDDDEHDDEIEELFKSLLHKVGKYNAEAVTLSYKDADNNNSNNNTQPISMLRQAFNIAREAHKNQCRRSGEPYITHPLGVAHIIADMELDLASLLTALLHDTVEDTNVTLGDIEEMFGGEISQCVDGVTKIAKIAFTSYEEQQSENYRKLILAMSKDIRVVLVKLADRLHNMRTLQYMPKEKQQRIARETMEIYAPLAHRLGIYTVKTELEDLCFRYLKPKKCEALEQQIKVAEVELKQYDEEVVVILERLMKEAGLGINSSLLVKGRTKGLWSIYNKMKRQDIELDDVHDVIGFRIILEDVASCYQALGVVHANFKPVPGRIKDLIALPKPNGYQSLHTTVIGPRGKRVEIQIRTKEMDEVAESGIAAHWIYKQGGGGRSSKDSNQFAWLRQLVDDVVQQSDPKEVLQSVKEDLFAKEVLVFSPTGELYPLARGSSVLDFAYKVHSDLGGHCTGAKVNGRIASIRYLLQNGDVVHIMTSKTQTPKREWLKHVRTSKAKSRIRAWLKRHQKENGVIMGKKQIEEGLEKYSKGDDAGKKEYQRKLDHLLTTFKLRDENHLFTALGYGQVSLKNVMTEIFGSAAITTVNNDRSDSATRNDRDSQVLKNKSQSVLSDLPSSNSNGIVVGRERNILLSFCRNCSPLRGDNIKGVITKGKGIKVHRTGCKYLSESDDTLVVDVTWDKSVKNVNLRPVQLQVICSDSPGVLADMSRAITSLGMNIGNVSVKKIKNGRGLARFEVMLGNLDELDKLIVQLGQEEGVISVSRR
eukprot:scaffold15273_cov83-Skeletonema_marinoi.AAC.2